MADLLAAVQTFGIDLAKIAKSIANGTFRIEDGELAKRCAKCREYWPADREFFYPAYHVPHGLHAYCKACYLEKRWPEGRVHPATGGLPP